MSGPIDDADRASGDLGVSTIEVREGRSTRIGQTGILRVLPTKGRRTVGPWCFVDLMAPDDLTNPPPLEIGPHPHIGLATVTWLFAGSVRHADSLGSEQLIRPGELNLMTSGWGIAHAEEAVETGVGVGGIMGAQMWLAQTEHTRHGDSAFQHLPELPRVDLGAAEASVLIGQLGTEQSGSKVDHPAVGLDLALRAPVDLPTDPSFEHGVVPIDTPVKVDDAIVEPGSLALVPPGYDHLRMEASPGVGRVLVVGGAPLGGGIKMWWNFVARSLDEITDAWRAWQEHDDDRFGPVPSTLARIDAPTPPWVRPT